MSRPTGTGTHDSLKKRMFAGGSVVVFDLWVCGLEHKLKLEIGDWRLFLLYRYPVYCCCVSVTWKPSQPPFGSINCSPTGN